MSADFIPLEKIAITGLTRTVDKKVGRRIIAYFDVQICGLLIRGCALIRTANDGLTISTPRLETDPARRGVSFTSDAVRNAVCALARKTYRVMGGDDLPDWAMKNAEHHEPVAA